MFASEPLSFSQEAVVHSREEAVPLRQLHLSPKTLASPAFFGQIMQRR
jgi:hypothetical protein